MQFDISKVDLKLLKSQKKDLVTLLSSNTIARGKFKDSLDGILNLLDSIQDAIELDEQGYPIEQNTNALRGFSTY